MRPTGARIVSLLLVGMTGCATIMTGTTESVSINTDPIGAKVELSNGSTCLTPCNISVPKKGTIQVTIRKDGCRTHTTALIPTLSGTGVVLGGLIDYGTGAVYHHQPNPLFVHLDCDPSVFQKDAPEAQPHKGNNILD